jgi:hypothetical protein
VVKYHGLARRYLPAPRFLMRPLLNGGTLGRLDSERVRNRFWNRASRSDRGHCNPRGGQLLPPVGRRPSLIPERPVNSFRAQPRPLDRSCSAELHASLLPSRLPTLRRPLRARPQPSCHRRPSLMFAHPVASSLSPVVDYHGLGRARRRNLVARLHRFRDSAPPPRSHSRPVGTTAAPDRAGSPWIRRYLERSCAPTTAAQLTP